MYLLIVFLPLLSAIVSGVFGRNMGTKGVGILSSFCISTSAGIAYYVLYEVVFNGATTYLVL